MQSVCVTFRTRFQTNTWTASSRRSSFLSIHTCIQMFFFCPSLACVFWCECCASVCETKSCMDRLIAAASVRSPGRVSTPSKSLKDQEWLHWRRPCSNGVTQEARVLREAVFEGGVWQFGKLAEFGSRAETRPSLRPVNLHALYLQNH